MGNVELEPKFSRNVFARNEKNVKLDWVLRNNSDSLFRGKVIITAFEEPLMKEREISLKKGEKITLQTQFSPNRFRIGLVDIFLHVKTRNGEKLKKKIPELRVGPWRNPEQLPIAVWPRTRETVCIKEVLDAGISIASFNNIPDLDNITLLGGYGGIHLRNYREDLCPVGEEYTEVCRKAVKDLLAVFENHPSIKYLLLNTEKWGTICFCDSCRKRYKEVAGIDVDVLEKYVKKGGPRRWKSHILIPPMKEYGVKGGVVDEDNPQLKFAYWWWEKGGDLNITHQMMADLLHEIRPDIMAVTEPIQRFAGVKRYGPPTVMSDWHYPRAPETWLPVLAYLKGIQKLWGVRFVPTIGLIKCPGDFAPYTITNPPDLVKIETWICLAHIPDAVGYFYWQGVQSPEQPYWRTAAVEECEEAVQGLSWKEACKVVKEKKIRQAWLPGVQEAIKTLSDKVFRPYGPMIRKLELKPAKVAVVYSFTSAIMGEKSWYQGHWWYSVVQKLVSGPYALDVIFDYDIEKKSVLDQYQAILLPSAFVLKRNGIRTLQKYINGGGVVLGGKSQEKNLSGLKVILDLDVEKAGKESGLNPELVWAEVSKRLLPEKECDNGNIILRESQAKDTRVLFAINNNRVPGPLFGHYKGSLEKGVPAKARIKVLKEGWKYCYELTSSKEIELADEGEYWSFRENFQPAWGKIYAFYKERIGEIKISSVNQAKLGSGVKIEVKILNEKNRRFKGLLPIRFEIFDPSGQKSDFSHYAYVEDSHYEFLWQVPVLTRRNSGHTGGWLIRVTELASGSTSNKTIDVVSSTSETSIPEVEERPEGKYIQR